MLENQTITVQVKMDYKTLRSFALFDTFRLKRRGAKPALFGIIFLVFAAICFGAVDKEQNWLLGSVMLLIGLGMPAVYVGMFLSQVKGQAKKLKLDPPRRVYTVCLSDECVRITNNLKEEEPVTLEWEKIPGAFRRKKAIYLYATPARAFILPDGQADATPDEVWAMLEKNLKPGRARR